jgi:hypothetical protein
MQARAGDMIVIKGHRLDEPDRTGQILEVRGDNGQPPYVVRWDDADERVHFFFPGPDAEVRHLSHQTAAH